MSLISIVPFRAINNFASSEEEDDDYGYDDYDDFDFDEQSSDDEIDKREPKYTNERLEQDKEKLFEVLTDTLKSFKKIGTFHCKGEEEVALPRIEINDVGVLAFPVQVSQVKHIIDKCIKAPFGKGTETITDTKIKNVWHLSPDSFKLIGGDQWNQFFKKTLKRVGEKLGLEETKIEAELHKMLIYDKGSFYKPHKDSEIDERIFGTLVISLPSAHSGGYLILQHAGKRVTLSLENHSLSTIKYAAFYSDIKHEVRKVFDGYRVCLVYNLCRSGKLNNDDLITKKLIVRQEETPSVKQEGNALKKQKMNDVKKEEQEEYSSSSEEEVFIIPVDSVAIKIMAKIRKYLSMAFRNHNRLVYIFEDEYTEDEYSVQCLIGKDRKLAKALLEAASGTGYTCLFGSLEMKEEGYLESGYQYYGETYLREGGDFDIEESNVFFTFKKLIDASTYDSYDGLDFQVDESNIFPSFEKHRIRWDYPTVAHDGEKECSAFVRFYRHSAIVLVKDLETNLFDMTNGEQAKKYVRIKDTLESG
ncbi:hypothetical protein PPL_00892 [Heterostelium album PN500]|uniref:Prolyl 4-hydroxylase alpha subunit Fe(2+) 2OG dioxygenase domain-containing protein n=1 Tax=Heterostelium pallidum (strain ATCC 26659 / Pp 5 / PN500) TaxID=670386 RepID=D3AYX3_HETP5|nr:hypothetical protein PPL_00892 [Heterostelium album PN500]EFA85663.1 hypothetical protein PPL_00892 [Heterostelium album PN500]|eukprot:XP_020437770.1 hypothetical protein PPL_00892 [Heterostelium album PN500]